MVSSETPRVESFVLRFVADEPADTAIPQALNPHDRSALKRWHGVVVHVQTNQEKRFTNFADAVAFIARYVPIGDFVFDDENEPPIERDERRKPVT